MKNLKVLVWSIFLFTALSTAGTVTLTGIVEVAEEGEDYKPTAVNLMVDDVSGPVLKTIYYKINTKKGQGKDLLSLVDAKVRVTAKKAGTTLTVDFFEIVEQHADPGSEWGDYKDKPSSDGPSDDEPDVSEEASDDSMEDQQDANEDASDNSMDDEPESDFETDGDTEEPGME